MFTRTVLKRAMTMGAAGSGRSTARSMASKLLARQPGSFLKGRWFRSTSSAWMAAFSSARLKKRRLRSRARIQRSTTCTPTSTLGLSRGCAGRAGSTATS
jgi:hypothetical protein